MQTPDTVTAITETSLELSTATRRLLLQRGRRLEYATLARNVAGGALVVVAAVAARSVALAGFGAGSATGPGRHRRRVPR